MFDNRDWRYILAKANATPFWLGWTGWRFNSDVGGSSLNFDLSESSTNYIRLHSGINTYDGREHEVVALWDGNTAELYIDGVLTSEADFSGNISNTLPIAIASTSAFAVNAKCIFRTLLMYSKYIEIDRINFDNPVRDNLVLWLPLSENQGTTAKDYSGNGNDCQLYNCRWVIRRPFRVLEVV